MKKKLTSNKHLWILLLLGLFFIVSSCTKELEKDELGPAISINEVANQFAQVVQHIDPTDIKTREWVVTLQKGMVMGQRIDRDAEILTQLDLYNVGDGQCADGNGILINYKQTVNKKVNGKNENFESDEADCIAKSQQDLLLGYVGVFFPPKDTISTLHDLRFSVGTETAPQGVVDQGCPNMASCEIRVFNVELKQKLVFPDGKTYLRLLQFKISPDVPYLARDLSFCITLAVDVNGTDVPIKQCLEVRNFGLKNE